MGCFRDILTRSAFGLLLLTICFFVSIEAFSPSPSLALDQAPAVLAGPPMARDLANPVPTGASNDQDADQDKPKAYITYKTPYEFYLTAITVVLGVLMAVLLSVLDLRPAVHTEILMAFLLVMIVFSSLFLIVAGYSEKQTAPVFGLLGTILGYMFGRSVDSDRATTRALAGTPAENKTTTALTGRKSTRRRPSGS